VPVNDEEFAAAVRETWLDMRLINQPANSPDLNVLDNDGQNRRSLACPLP